MLLGHHQAVVLFDAERLEPIAAWSLHRPISATPDRIAFLPDGRLLAAGGEEVDVYDGLKSPN